MCILCDVQNLHILEVLKEQNLCMGKVVCPRWQDTDFPRKVQADDELEITRMLSQTSS